mgnify:CR=1 FL=1
MLKKIFRWVFKKELNNLKIKEKELSFLGEKLETKINLVNNLLGNIDVSVDVNRHSPSWAVISIQGEKSDYIKFVDLGQRDIKEIQRFLHHFDRNNRKIDAPFQERNYLKFN